MRPQKKIDYYLENGAEKVKPMTKQEALESLSVFGDGIDSVLNSPLFWDDNSLINKIEEFSLNLIKFYPWKMYIIAAEKRGIDINKIIANLPEYSMFKIVDEDEYPEYY